ncbi:MAG: hypothetical protein M3R27_01755 [Bacteroidota bacterium]|nr:hypothetical protein [Bacteroidota bacterium]
MKHLLILFFALTYTLHTQAQSNEYFALTSQAENFLADKQYLKSARHYSKAFKSNGGKAYRDDRYNSAKAWSLSGNKDSALYQLNKVASLYDFVNYNQVLNDQAFIGLHADARWNLVLDRIRENIGKSEKSLNKGLVTILDSIYREAQTPRMKAVSVKNEYGWNSKQSNELWKSINKTDSTNLLVVEDLIKKYGWLGKESVGSIGNSTLALVILHSGLDVQEKYLPVMREAVADGKADPGDLALLEDRVALLKGKKQIYGSVVISFDGKKYYISPMEDPEQVDKRRSEIGLNTMNDYLKGWGLKWDIKKYKRELSVFETQSIDYSYLFFEK